LTGHHFKRNQEGRNSRRREEENQFITT